MARARRSGAGGAARLVAAAGAVLLVLTPAASGAAPPPRRGAEAVAPRRPTLHGNFLGPVRRELTLALGLAEEEICDVPSWAALCGQLHADGARILAAVALRAPVAHDAEVGDLNRFQPVSLGVAALTLLLALSVSHELVIGFLLCEIGCLALIWASEAIGTYIGLGVTQETPGGCLVVVGWIGQAVLLLMAVAIIVLRVARR